MARMLAILLSAVLMFTCLAGCNREEAPSESTQTLQTEMLELPDPGEPEKIPEPEPEEVEEKPQPVTPQIKLLVQEYGGGQDRYDGIAEIPVFSIGGQQEDLENFNRAMQELANEYAAFKESTDFVDAGAWAEIKTYPRTSERYVQVVVSCIYYPNYATQGDLIGCCFDLKEQRVVTLEDVYQQYGITEAGLAQLFKEQVGEPNEGDVLEKVEPVAFLLEDDSAEIYVRVYYQNDLSSDRDDRFCYSTSAGKFYRRDGERLTDAETLDDMDTPLSYDREEAPPEQYGITDTYIAAKELLLQYVDPQLEEGETLTFINNGIFVVDGVSCYMINLGAATETSLTQLGSFAVAEDLSCVYMVDPMTGEFTERLDR